jgi:hypothetical protein
MSIPSAISSSEALLVPPITTSRLGDRDFPVAIHRHIFSFLGQIVSLIPVSKTISDRYFEYQSHSLKMMNNSLEKSAIFRIFNGLNYGYQCRLSLPKLINQGDVEQLQRFTRFGILDGINININHFMTEALKKGERNAIRYLAGQWSKELNKKFLTQLLSLNCPNITAVIWRSLRISKANDSNFISETVHSALQAKDRKLVLEMLQDRQIVPKVSFDIWVEAMDMGDSEIADTILHSKLFNEETPRDRIIAFLLEHPEQIQAVIRSLGSPSTFSEALMERAIELELNDRVSYLLELRLPFRPLTLLFAIRKKIPALVNYMLDNGAISWKDRVVDKFNCVLVALKQNNMKVALQIYPNLKDPRFLTTLVPERSLYRGFGQLISEFKRHEIEWDRIGFEQEVWKSFQAAAANDDAKGIVCLDRLLDLIDQGRLRKYLSKLTFQEWTNLGKRMPGTYKPKLRTLFNRTTTFFRDLTR